MVGRHLFQGNKDLYIFYLCFAKHIIKLCKNCRYVDVDQDKLAEFNQKLDWLNNGTYAYHLPRHGSLFTKSDYEKANKSLLPIKIATYILNLPSDI